jgi:hypothetical protein
MVVLESQILGLAWTWWGCQGKQFGRYACGFTPACGSKDASSTRECEAKAEVLGYLGVILL